MPSNVETFFKSRAFQGFLAGTAVVLIGLLIFQAGVAVGYRRAAFAFHFGDNYYRAFDGRDARSPSWPLRGRFIDAHGAAGKIVSIALPTFVVADRDNLEKVVRLSDDAVVRRFSANIEPSALSVGDFVVVFGIPNADAQIEATLVRVVPQPASSTKQRETEQL